MKVSIVIPTKNRVGVLEETIAHILTRQNYPQDKLEIIIINDGEEFDDSFRQKYPGVKIQKNKGAGAASARNTGAELATNELLLFIDDDILIAKNCIERHVKLHELYKESIVSGTWKYDDSLVANFKKTAFGRYKLLYDYQPDKIDKGLVADGVYSIECLASFNLSIIKADFNRIGGFNLKFPFAGCEDQEFTMRAKEIGFALLFDTLNISINNEKDRANLDKWLNRQYTGVQGYVMLCDIFPYKKQEKLYLENAPISKNDSLNLKLKKTGKYWLSINASLILIKGMTRVLEKIGIEDKVLFKLYNTLCGLYLSKGFRYSYKNYKKIN
jgi:glycosyltransferase involved in cell wall biosynthesis